MSREISSGSSDGLAERFISHQSEAGISLIVLLLRWCHP